MKCLFCSIISGDIPAHRVYENDQVFAFLDIHPKTKGHTLVIPKNHAENIFDISVEDLTAINAAVQLIAKQQQTVLEAQGVNILQNNGAIAQQEVPHYHMHVIPRYEDSQAVQFAKEYTPEEGELEHIGHALETE